jgi:hypothetical protein
MFYLICIWFHFNSFSFIFCQSFVSYLKLREHFYIFVLSVLYSKYIFACVFTGWKLKDYIACYVFSTSVQCRRNGFYSAICSASKVDQKQSCRESTTICCRATSCTRGFPRKTSNQVWYLLFDLKMPSNLIHYFAVLF